MVIIVIVALGYTHLLRESQKRSVSALVKLNVQSREKDEITDLPKDLASLTKLCQFVVTPVPGMELVPSGIDGAVIERVLVDEGLVEVWCVQTIRPFGLDFETTCRALKERWVA